jgi:hypothetical protein
MAATLDSEMAAFISDCFEDERDVFSRGWLYTTSRSDIRLFAIPEREVAGLSQEELGWKLRSERCALYDRKSFNKYSEGRPETAEQDEIINSQLGHRVSQYLVALFAALLL